MLLNILMTVLFAGPPAEMTPLAEATVQACPAELPATRKAVERFLTHPSFEAERQAVGAARTLLLLRVLNDRYDTATCTFLNSHLGSGGQYGEWRWAYYTDGSLYYVAAVRPDAGGTRRVGLVPFLVFDKYLNYKAGYGM